MSAVLDELQRILTPLALAAFTAFVAYAFGALRTWLGVQESDSNEAEIRRAAETEAGKLVVQGKIDDASALVSAASKVVADLPDAVKAEGYDASDVKDMIIGAAATFFPPANILKLLK